MMNECDRCHGTRGITYIVDDGARVLCHACCVQTATLVEGYAWSRNALTGHTIMIPEESKGVPYLDPAYERYHCM